MHFLKISKITDFDYQDRCIEGIIFVQLGEMEDG